MCPGCVPDGWTVRLLVDSGFKGDFLLVTGPFAIPDLKRESPDWGDKISSIEVTGPNSNQPPPACRLIPVLFEDDNFRGRQFDLDRDARNLHQGDKVSSIRGPRGEVVSFKDTDYGFGDKASSVCVPSGWQVVLFEDTDFGGRSLTINGQRAIADLARDRPNGLDWGDKISSFRVIPPASAPPSVTCSVPTLYEHDGFRGRELGVRTTRQNLHGFGVGDIASSVCVPSGWTITLFVDSNFGGRSLHLTGPIQVNDLKRNAPDGQDWGDKFSSVQVIPPSGTPPFVPCSQPTLFKDDHYGGKALGINSSIADLHREGMGDKASSVCVPAGYTITLFQDKNFHGRSLRLVGPREVLDLKRDRPDGQDWGDKISSVQVN